MTEEIPYEVTGRIGEVEFRKYPAIRVATVSGFGDNEAFMFLFRFITGKNQGKKKIAMTAPVITAETIPMTAPVISDLSTMSFVMPEQIALADLPEPLEPVVRLQEIPPREVAVIRFSGKAGRQSVEEMTARLLQVLVQEHIRATGTPFLMRYNPPFIPGFLRRNEVGIEIRRDDGGFPGMKQITPVPVGEELPV
jgi:effector-binding domain-containing protein